MRLAEQYDWIVLGDHPGALLSASLAAKLGLSVLVLPLGETFRAGISNSGQLMDSEPNFLVGTDRPKMGLLAQCFSKIGLLPSEEEGFEAASESQVVTPQVRFALKRRQTDLDQELLREFGVEAQKRCGLSLSIVRSGPEVVRFWSKLPQRLTVPHENGVKAAKSEMGAETDLARYLAKHPSFSDSVLRNWLSKNHSIEDCVERISLPELREPLLGFWYALTHSLEEGMTPFDLLQSICLSQDASAFRGGPTAYRSFLHRVARRCGAEVMPEARCKRLFVENGRFQGVQLVNSANMIAAGGAVLGCSLAHVKEHAFFENSSLLRRLKPVPIPLGWRFTLSLTVAAQAIPPEAARRIVWKEAQAPVLEIETVDPAHYGLRKQDQRILFLRTIMPFTDESLKPEFQRLIAARMMRQVCEVIPFLEGHVASICPDFRGEKMSHDFLELYGFPSLEFIPDNLRCYSIRQGVGSQSGIDGLYISSEQSYPGLGSLGGTVAALEAVAAFAHRSGLNGPLL